MLQLLFSRLPDPLTAFFLTRDKGVAAVVNGVKIETVKVEEEIVKAKAQYESQGQVLQAEQLEQVRASIIDNMIIREVMLQESQSYELTQEEIEEQITSFKGRFADEAAFLEALTAQGFDLESFTIVHF